MKKIVGFLLVFTFLTGIYVFAGDDYLKSIDQLHEDGNYTEEFQLLNDRLAEADSDTEKAEIYWRLSRTILELTDQLERDGASKDKLLQEFDRGVSFADKSLSLNPDNYNAYYWRSANTGRWGETKGILDSLFKAPSMRDDLEKAINSNPTHGDSYYVLGRLYYAVPGIISFGNKDYAVSLARKSIDNQEKKARPYHYSYYLALAKDLWERNWKSSKRLKEQKKKKGQYNSKSSLLEKNWFYEGVIDYSRKEPYSTSPLAQLSDREEAVQIVEWLEKKLSSLTDAKPGDVDDLKEVRELLKDWK